MIADAWDVIVALLAVLTPLVAVPLTIITFYLRSLREQQVAWRADLARRMDALESTTVELRRWFKDFERNYTTKEEWLRECLHARRLLEQLTVTTIRLETLAGGSPQPQPSVRAVHPARLSDARRPKGSPHE